MPNTKIMHHLQEMPRWLMLFICLFMLPALWAKSITVQVVQRSPFSGQTGVQDLAGSRGAVSQSSQMPFEETYVIEDAVMDAMFDEGHIVTNFSSICRPAGKTGLDSRTVARAVDNALMGGSRYFVMFFVDYKDNVRDLSSPEAVLMENIEGMAWQSYDTRTREMIGQGCEKAFVPKKDCRESVTKWAIGVAKKVIIN